MAVEAALECVINQFETGVQFYHDRDEHALAHQLVMCLQSGGIPTQNESFCNGHVDVTITHPIRAAWRELGECKIYRGPVHHIDGCDQLLRRYATGRLLQTFCLDFVQESRIAQKMKGIRDHMDRKLPLNQRSRSCDHRIRWAFTTVHAHSSGEEVAILHLGCNVHHAES